MGERMANRTIQQKLRKLKRRHRFARFSGGQTKFVRERATGIIRPDGEEIYVPIGPISLSKQVPKGKGPNAERMQQYYNTVKPDSFKVPVPVRTSKQMEQWLNAYHVLIEEAGKHVRVNLSTTKNGKLDLLYERHSVKCFFVEINYEEQFFRRSKVYSSRETALDRLKNRRIAWEEYLRS